MDGGGHLRKCFFVYVELDSNFGSPSLACWELGLQTWAIKYYSRHQSFAQSFPGVSGIIIKVDRDWCGFYIFESVYRLVSSTFLFCPNFSEVFVILDMWRVLSHDSLSAIWIISSFQWRGDESKRSINCQLDCAINWGAQKWNFIVFYWKTNINIQIYS